MVKYILVTKKDIQWRWNQHVIDSRKSTMRISKAIKKYGEGNFNIDIIDCCHDLDQMNELEKYWIKEFNSCETGYNSSLGGNNQCQISDEIREKISAKQKAFWASPESANARQKLKDYLNNDNHRMASE